MKRIKLLVIAILSVLLVACGGGSGDGNATNKGDGEKATGQNKLKFSSQEAEAHFSTEIMEMFMENIEKDTDEEITFDFYHSNQLGDYTTVFEELIKGTIDMAVISFPSSIDKRLEAINLPYLIRDYEQATRMFSQDSYLYEFIDDVLDDQGLKLLGLVPAGFGGIGTTKEIQNDSVAGEDKDLLVRIPEMAIHENFAKEMGFRTSAIPYADVFTALQTGTVEGVIGASVVTNYLNFRDVITHFYKYNNTFEPKGMIINKALFESFTEEQQELMEKYGNEFTQRGIAVSEEQDTETLSKYGEEGIEVIEYSAEEIAAFAEHMYGTVWEKAKKDLGEDLVNKLIEEAK